MNTYRIYTSDGAIDVYAWSLERAIKLVERDHAVVGAA